MGIFSDNAPRYWEKGMPAIPLHKFDITAPSGTPLGKAPVIMSWQRYNDSMPTAEDREKWLAEYGENNIGMALGKQSRCIALDIDSEVEAEVALIESLVPPSPWIRVGRHGKVMMYRFNGEQTFRIKDITGRTICELLSSKTQVVIPPSIHPDTKKPYVANCNLYDVVDRLPVLPSDIENILRTSLSEKMGVELGHSGWTRTIDFVSAGSRDVKMTSMAGIYAMAVIRGECTLKEAIDMLRAWVATQTEKVAGDNIDPEKGVKNLVKFLLRNVQLKNRILPKGWDEGLTKEELEQLGAVVDKENEAWDFARVNNYLVNKIHDTQPYTQERSDAISYLIDRVANSPNLSNVEEEQIIKRIAQSGSNLTATVIRKEIQSLRSSGINGENQTEIAVQVLRDMNELIPVYENVDQNDPYPNIKYDESVLWRWGGSNWEPVPDLEVKRMISTEYGSLPSAKKANDHDGILRIMKALTAQKLSETPAPGINFANGYVDVFKQIHPHSRKYGAKYTLPYCYRPELADLSCSPRFEAYLKSVWGDDSDYKEKVKALQEAMAATIFGIAPSFNRAFLLEGVGGSGKSQLLAIMRKLLPAEMITTASPYMFADKFVVTELSHSLLNICGELDSTKEIPSAIFKQVVDGTPIQGQYKGREIFNFTPRAAQWMCSNFLPKSQDATEGFNRRWLIFEFTRIVPEKEKVRGLGDLIAAEERESITAWCVEAIPELNAKSDYDLPPSHYRMIDEMMQQNDSTFFWISSRQGPRALPGAETPAAKLYESYRTFCYGEASAKPVGLRKFLARLKELGLIYGFSVSDLKVSGLTTDKEAGSPVSRALRSK